MITRITLDNYMSHGHTVIEPAAGLTVILGPNNCGKSAILSAIQTLCGDNDGDFMVRHGEQNCTVTVETDDGHSIVWRRIKGKVSYVLDGVEVHRAGRGNLPDDLQKFLRLPKVLHPNGNDEFDIHFGRQKTPIFLIDDQAGTAAFFSTASDAEKLMQMQKLHKEKEREAKSERKKLAAQSELLDAQLIALSPLDELDQQLSAVEESQRQLQARDLAAESLSLLIEQIERQNQLVKFRAAHVKSIAPLRSPPELIDPQPIETLIDRINSITRQTNRLNQDAAILAAATPPPDQFDIAPLEHQIKKLAAASLLERSTRAKSTALSQLLDPPPSHDTAPLANFITRFDLAAQNLHAAQTSHRALASLTEPPAIDDPTPLLDLIARISHAAANTAQIRRSITDHDQQLAHIDADINAWLWANPTCPTCGATTTRDNLFIGHAHPPARAVEAAHD